MNKLVYILLLITTAVFCQECKTLQGRVMSNGALVSGVFVINKVTGTETKTDGKANFSLPARNGDRLVVYSTGTEVREFVINDESFKDMPYVLEVKTNAYELTEVVINDINPESLGIVPKGQKQYTVAERRVKTAGEFKPTFMFFLGGGIAMPLDPIINAISGRTKMLKKALATERKEFAMERLNGIYTEEQIVNELKVPREYVQGFLFYAVEDPDCAAALKAKNNALAKLILMTIAQKYNKVIQQELPLRTDIIKPKE